MKSLFYISISIFYISCNADNIPPCTSCNANKDTIEVIWKKSLTTQSIIWNLKPLIYEGSVIFSFSDEIGNQNIARINESTGEVIWTKNLFQPANSKWQIGIFQNLGLITYGKYTSSFDLNTGENIWSYSGSQNIENNFRSTVISNMLFQGWSMYSGDEENDSIGWLMRSPVSKMNWDTVCTIKRDKSELTLNIEPPSLWINPNFDSVLIFNSRNLQRNLLDRSNIYAFNLKTNKYLWSIQDICSENLATIEPIQIQNNVAYLLGAYFVYAIDLINGVLLWKTSANNPSVNNNLNGHFNVIGNSLIVKSGGNVMYAASSLNGNKYWINENVDVAYTSNLVIQNGMIYYLGTDFFNILNANTGELINKYSLPASFKDDYYFPYAGLTIDPIKKNAYFSTKKFALCVKLPK